ncbi:hypothetical protein AVEN_123487-1 [Araneus ventricosus]|uniref:Uncharacterized protein n=1 Tax=Araneus ventricosus TaxID=182803 RepID=A0A4Y2P256_ARAVE|nr:hypothetical protein AVEN_123487-1 [Araneus ventricosus]
MASLSREAHLNMNHPLPWLLLPTLLVNESENRSSDRKIANLGFRRFFPPKDCALESRGTSLLRSYLFQVCVYLNEEHKKWVLALGVWCQDC